MPLTCNIWRNGNLTSNPPDEALVPCNKSLGNRNAGSFLACGQAFGLGGMWLLVPYGTRLYGCESLNCSDTVECPAGSGSFYICRWADNAAEGFGNQYRFGHIQAIQLCVDCCPPGGSGPPPVEITTAADPFETVFNEQTVGAPADLLHGTFDTGERGVSIWFAHYVGGIAADISVDFNGTVYFPIDGYHHWTDGGGTQWGTTCAFYIPVPSAGTWPWDTFCQTAPGTFWMQMKVRFLNYPTLALWAAKPGSAGTAPPFQISGGADIKHGMHNFVYWGLKGASLGGLINSVWIGDTPDIFRLEGGSYYGLGDAYINPNVDALGYDAKLIGGAETRWAGNSLTMQP